MADFHNIFNHNNDQQQYLLMERALVGVPHDEFQHFSGSFGYGDDFTPTWDSPASYFPHRSRHGETLPPAEPYVVTVPNSPNSMPMPVPDGHDIPTPPRSSSPYFPTVSELLKSTPRALNPETIQYEADGSPPPPEEPAFKVKGTRTPFTSHDIRKLMAVVCEVNPFMAEWGNVGKKWLEVCTKTRKAMACVSHSNGTIQNKVTALLEYQKDPNTKTGAQIGRELGQDGGVQVAALLEKALHQRDMAMAMKENKKGKAAKKLEDDKAGGEAVCDASLTTHHHHHHSNSTDSSDAENVDPKHASGSRQPPAKRVKHHSSLAGLQSDIGDMKDMLESSAKSQQKYNEDMVDVLRSSNTAYVRSQETFVDIFHGKF